MTFTVTIDRDEDGVWVIECPAIPGCVSQGKTKEEALENVRDAIKLCLEVRAAQGLPLSITSAEPAMNGGESILLHVDDFEQEVASVQQQPELMALLERRSHPSQTFTLDEVRKALGL